MSISMITRRCVMAECVMVMRPCALSSVHCNGVCCLGELEVWWNVICTSY